MDYVNLFRNLSCRDKNQAERMKSVNISAKGRKEIDVSRKHRKNEKTPVEKRVAKDRRRKERKLIESNFPMS